MSELNIFTEALNCPDAKSRAAFLDVACAGNEEMLQRLHELLKMHDSGSSLLDARPQEVLESLGSLPDTAGGNPVAKDMVVQQLLSSVLSPGTLPESIGQLGHYEVLEILGHGGYGIVIKAKDTKLDRLVAIKILMPSLAATSPPRKRFLREARLAAAVRHDNVVQIYAVEESPLPFIVMEFINGETLQERFDRHGPLDAAEVVRIGLQIASGLAAAHKKGVIHRDVKPTNILLEDGVRPRVKLSDFGLARTSDDASMTQSGQIVGTPLYMSPEQVQGGILDHRADLFSFGSVLYAMCTGHPPFRAPTTLGVLKRVAEGQSRSIKELIPETPEGLCRIIEKLHEKSREQRFASAEEVAAALLTCLTDPDVVPEKRRSGLRQPVGFRWSRAVTAWLVLGAAAIVFAVASGRWPTGRWWKRVESPPARVSTPANVIATETDVATDVVANALLESVMQELKQRNPRLSHGPVTSAIENGKVVQFVLPAAARLSDITPLSRLTDLTSLELAADYAIGGADLESLEPLKGLKLRSLTLVGFPVRDLSPLRGMPLENCGLWGWKGTDLSPLHGMPLRSVNVGQSNVIDLEPLRGLALEQLYLSYSQVADLSPLEGMPLRILQVDHTNVSDLSPIAKAPLRHLKCDDSKVTDHSVLRGSNMQIINLTYDAERDREVLESMPMLTEINSISRVELLSPLTEAAKNP